MILTIGPDNTTGYRKHLEGISYLMNPDAKYLKVNSKYAEILPSIQENKPDFSIIGGRNWIIRNESILKEIPGKKSILFCSPLAQGEISGEEIDNLNLFMDWLNKGKIDYIFTGSKDLANVIDNKSVIHLPAPLIELDFKKSHYSQNKSIALLSDHTNHKNVMNAFASLSLSKEVEQIIINGISPTYSNFLNHFGIQDKIVNKGKLPYDQYLSTLRESTLLLHPSFSEGFCYTAYEAIMEGTPAIVSGAVNWISDPRIIISNPVDVHEMSNKIDSLLKLNEKDYSNLVNKCQDDARKIATINNFIVKNNLGDLL